MMIARLWSARTTKPQYTRYLEHFWHSVVPSLRQFDGYVSSSVLVRPSGEAVEILVTTVWKSLQAIDAFAGPDRETAVVASEAAALLRITTGVCGTTRLLKWTGFPSNGIRANSFQESGQQKETF
jgi:heme-degrading monooxygenase HmoA